MGKRKSSARAPPKKRQEKLPTTFTCPFCNAPDGVECELEYKERIGTVQCRICLEGFSTPINNLSFPIDVYTDWIDACERVNNCDSKIVNRVRHMAPAPRESKHRSK